MFKLMEVFASMTLNQLSYLIEISKCHSLSIASQKLHISTQALSASIKRLEEELELELLNRSFKGVSLTEDGEWLVESASIFFNELEKRKKQYLNSKNHFYNGNLHISINYSGFNDNIVGQLITRLYEQEPGLKISLKELSKENILDEVKKQNSELGFIYRTKVNGAYIDELDSNLTFVPLFCGNPVLLTSSNTKIAKFNTVTLKHAVQYPVCNYDPQIDAKNALNFLITEIFKLSVQYESESNFSIYKEKIKRGLANTISVYFPIENQPQNYIEGTKVIHLRDDIKTYFGYIKKKEVPLSNNGIFFLQELRGLIHDLQCQDK